MTKSRARKFADIMGGTFVGLIEDGQIDIVDVDGLSALQTKLNGIEAGATGDQTAAEIRSLVEAATDSNVFTDADHTKLDAIEANAKDDQTITAGSGLTGGGTGNVTLSHSDTSSQGSVNNSGATVVQDVTLDTYGHVTGLGSHTLTLANLGYTGATNANYITNNNQLTNGAGYTTNVGDITNVTAGTNLTGGGSSGSVTVNLTASPNITSLNVGGSEVVSSSRALKNIASVDATTAAAITAGGVGGSIPSGTRMLFQQTSAPTGWTKDTTHNNKALRVVNGTAGSGGSVAFTTAFANKTTSGSIGNTSAGGTVAGHTLTTAETPSHSHYLNGNGNMSGGFSYGRIVSTGGVAYYTSYTTNSIGSNGSHSHGFTGASHNHSFSGSAIDLRVQYVDLIIASKD